MRKASVYPTVIVMTLAALVVLLVLQVYWFAKAYTIQEQQFDRTVNIALRSVTDKLMQLHLDTHQRIAPIRQTASNTFLVAFNGPLAYPQLNSLLRQEFLAHDIQAPF